MKFWSFTVPQRWCAKRRNLKKHYRRNLRRLGASIARMNARIALNGVIQARVWSRKEGVEPSGYMPLTDLEFIASKALTE